MAEMRNRDRKRLSVEAEAGMSIDRISKLPDSVLCLILSFLPTLCSVRTTVLSRRWKCLWTKVPSLYFNNDHEYFSTSPGVSDDDDNIRRAERFGMSDARRFERFVNGVLLLHDARSLDMFRLNWTICCPYYLEIWISTAIARNLRHLELNLKHKPIPDLPVSVFTCKTLELLELWNDFAIEAPSLVHLPRLETLILVLVRFCEDSFVKLVDGCPVLRSLSFLKGSVGFDDPATVTVSSPSLRRLTLSFEGGLGYISPYSLVINAPSLEYLSISDNMSQEFDLQSLTSLLHVEIDVSHGYYQGNLATPDYCNSVVKLVQGLCHAKYIDLQGKTIKYFENATVQLSAKFHTLSKLVVTAKCCGWNSLQVLLECAVNLEVLVLEKISFHGDTDHVSWRNPKRVPRCLLSSLEEVSFIGFDDIEYDLAMIRYSLKYGEVLKKVELYAAKGLDYRSKFEMLKKISVFCRKSSTCEIHFLEKNSRSCQKLISRKGDRIHSVHYEELPRNLFPVL